MSPSTAPLPTAMSDKASHLHAIASRIVEEDVGLHLGRLIQALMGDPAETRYQDVREVYAHLFTGTTVEEAKQLYEEALYLLEQSHGPLFCELEDDAPSYIAGGVVSGWWGYCGALADGPFPETVVDTFEDGGAHRQRAFELGHPDGSYYTFFLLPMTVWRVLPWWGTSSDWLIKAA